MSLGREASPRDYIRYIGEWLYAKIRSQIIKCKKELSTRLPPKQNCRDVWALILCLIIYRYWASATAILPEWWTTHTVPQKNREKERDIIVNYSAAAQASTCYISWGASLPNPPWKISLLVCHVFSGAKCTKRGLARKGGILGRTDGQRFCGKDGVALLRHDSKLSFF